MLLLTVFVISLAGGAEAKKPWEKIKIPELNDIETPEYVRQELDNGMVIYLAEDHVFPLINLSATIQVGSIYEPNDKVGLAAMTGGVLRTGGTTSRSGDDIDALVEARGIEVETWVGQSTGGAYLSALAEDTALGLELLGDILMHPVFDQEKIDLAKEEQKAAISRRNDQPMSIAQREAMKVIFGSDHPLARHPEYDTIAAVTRDDMIDFHTTYYHADRVYLVVVGDFEAEAMLAKIEAVFGDWSRATEPLPPDPEIPDLPRTVNVVDKDDLTQSTIVLGHKGIRNDDPNYAAIQVANRILGGGFSSRLFTEIRSNRGYAYSVGSAPGTGWRNPGMFMAFTMTKSATVEAATDGILTEIHKMLDEPVTEEELRTAKDGILNSEVFSFDTKREILDRQVLFEMYGYPSDFLQQYQEQVKGMTAEKIQAAAQAVWRPDDMTIFALGNPEDWDGDLSQYGAINEIDITIPEPSLELDIPLATPQSLEAGHSLVVTALDALGGAKLETLKAYSETRTMTVSVQGMELAVTEESTVVYPDRAHNVQKTPFGDMTSVVNSEAGWRNTPGGVQDLSADELADAHQGIISETYFWPQVLNELTAQALDPAEVDGVACNPVYLTGLGDDYQIVYFRADNGLPLMVQSPGEAPMSGAPVTQKVYYDEYHVVDGVKVAKTFRVLFDDEPFATGSVTSFRANPQLDEAMFQK